MCLVLSIKLSEKDALLAEQIAVASTFSEGLEVQAKQRWLRRRTPFLSIFEHSQGCACSLLTDDADWDAPAWDMHELALPKLASTLRKLRDSCSQGFVFEAMWIGDAPAEERRVTIDELVEIIREGKVGTKTKYHVE